MNGQSEIKFQKQPFVGINNEEARAGRVDFLKSLGHELNTYSESQLEANSVKSNIESFIGTMTIPVGLVGPLLYKNDLGVSEQVFAPAATTEGALIASMNRGVSVMNLSGGFNAFVKKQRMLRSPMFCFENIFDAQVFEEWIQSQKSNISEYIKQFSTRAKLIEIKSDFMGRNLVCHFCYETADASGQNMTTICTWQACLWIEQELKKIYPSLLKDYVLDCNGSSDKKVTQDSIINGRGVDVTAEVIIPEDILQKKLKITSKEILNWYNKSSFVVNLQGMVGNNVNVANPIAAIFAATGQDLACVHESAVGYLYFEAHETGLYACLKLPRLVIATIGGGTSLPSQNENLNIMGCAGSGKLHRFAKLLAGYCLGLELSTFTAMVNGQFAIAHERLGRNKPVNFLTAKEDIGEFLKEKVLFDKTTHIAAIDRFENSNGIITELTSQNTDKYLGLSIWDLMRKNESVVGLLKSKPSDKEVLNCMYILTGLIDPKLAKTFDQYKPYSDFFQGHKKEIQIYKKIQSDHFPKVYGVLEDDERETYLIMMEFLQNSDFSILNSEMTPSVWDDKSLKTVIVASINIQKSLSELEFNNKMYSFVSTKDFMPFARHSFEVLSQEYGEQYREYLDLNSRSLDFLENFDEDKLKTCVIHNDFNPRNTGVKLDGSVIAYDFELARIDCPQRDIIEFLSFTLGSEEIKQSTSEILSNYRIQLAKLGKFEFSDVEWKESLRYSLAKYISTRLNLYLLGNKITRYSFINLVVENTISLSRFLKL
ncbi:MAG: hydroxymethylglutaryl-CoA reductase (NADPH) [Bacteriovoracaceae bacterium]|jgi:hydroxymethylglutaryl-CoA reductase (NADPH)